MRAPLMNAHSSPIALFQKEPMLRSVETYDLAQPDQLERALDEFDQLGIKPRAGHGGVGVVIAPHALAEDVAAVRKQVEASPGDWIAQRLRDGA